MHLNFLFILLLLCIHLPLFLKSNTLFAMRTLHTYLQYFHHFSGEIVYISLFAVAGSYVYTSLFLLEKKRREKKTEMGFHRCSHLMRCFRRITYIQSTFYTSFSHLQIICSSPSASSSVLQQCRCWYYVRVHVIPSIDTFIQLVHDDYYQIWCIVYLSYTQQDIVIGRVCL